MHIGLHLPLNPVQSWRDLPSPSQLYGSTARNIVTARHPTEESMLCRRVEELTLPRTQANGVIATNLAANIKLSAKN